MDSSDNQIYTEVLYVTLVDPITATLLYLVIQINFRSYSLHVEVVDKKDIRSFRYGYKLRTYFRQFKHLVKHERKKIEKQITFDQLCQRF